MNFSLYFAPDFSQKGVAMERILLACGNGGKENADLIKVFMRHFGDFTPFGKEDAGIFGALKAENYAISTDSYTISPIFFPGGDIGKLSICGSCNDVAMMGAKPQFITASFIIAEGFLVSDLERIIKSMAREIAKNHLTLLSADTKVVPKSAMDGIFITTTAIGVRDKSAQNISATNLQNGDSIILSAPIGAHGACIYCLQNHIDLDNNLKSDCASLWAMIEPLLARNLHIHAMRDATRGGIAASLNEWAQSSQKDIILDAQEILVPNEVSGICEILGLEPYMLANEGCCVIALPREEADSALEILRESTLGANAKIIGEVVESAFGNKVVMTNAWGVKRYLDYPEGEILPRIC